MIFSKAGISSFSKAIFRFQLSVSIGFFQFIGTPSGTFDQHIGISHKKTFFLSIFLVTVFMENIWNLELAASLLEILGDLLEKPWKNPPNVR